MAALGAATLVAAMILAATGDNEETDSATAARQMATPAEQPAALQNLTKNEQNNIAVFREVSPSVVFVTNTQLRRELFSLNVMEIPRGSGSGFVWDDSGLIVTNFHVVYNANKIVITVQSGNEYEAEVVGVAPEKDIALLRIDAPEEELRGVRRGDSDDLSVGRKVLAIGNPFALDTTLTIGVISALGREIKSFRNRTIKNVIQTDAAINPGNSGGPLLNSRGELIGVNTAIFSPSGASAGIGFAIPVNTLERIIPQLIEHGELFRPVLGINTLNDRWSKRLRVQGVPVLSVEADTPADEAGMVGMREDRRGNIHLGDVIIAINDNPVTDQDGLLSLLEQHQPGDKVTVTTMRDEEIHNYEVTLKAPED